MRNCFVFLALINCILTNALITSKNKSKVTLYKKPLPEKSLLGIYLFDSVEKIAEKYGSPNLIQSAEPKEKEEEANQLNDKDKIICYTKWIYKKVNSQYAFTIAKDGKVIRIECLGLYNPQAMTHKKIKLGDEFSKVIKLYGSPESYSLMENYSTARYNNKYHLEFKFANTKPGQPLKVVGMILSSLKMIDTIENNEKKKM